MKIRDRIFVFIALAKLKWIGARMTVYDAILRHLRRKRQPEINYCIDDFLKMEDSEEAYWALVAAMQKEKHRVPLPVEIRVMSLQDFTGLCPNGFTNLYMQANWAVVPSAELMEAIDEPVLAGELWRCIGIVREYGQRVGQDPFEKGNDWLDLDEETEKKLYSGKFNFSKSIEITDIYFRKTMDYVRKNRELFVQPNQP
jgi:hypothetical protein